MNYVKASKEKGDSPTSYLDSYLVAVQKLKREDRRDEAIASLLELVDATEEDNLFTGVGVTPAYYEQLAIIFRERKEYRKEISILARYATQKHMNGDSRQEILKKRLEEARKLFTKNKPTM